MGISRLLKIDCDLNPDHLKDVSPISIQILFYKGWHRPDDDRFKMVLMLLRKKLIKLMDIRNKVLRISHSDN